MEICPATAIPECARHSGVSSCCPAADRGRSRSEPHRTQRQYPRRPRKTSRDVQGHDVAGTGIDLHPVGGGPDKRDVDIATASVERQILDRHARHFRGLPRPQIELGARIGDGGRPGCRPDPASTSKRSPRTLDSVTSPDPASRFISPLRIPHDEIAGPGVEVKRTMGMIDGDRCLVDVREEVAVGTPRHGRVASREIESESRTTEACAR